ncbi:MAG: cell division protein ZapE [Gammaproteobacteria bacterium]|nr:cell division protein ZapE [Gammaproteobacteria bacterium]
MSTPLTRYQADLQRNGFRADPAQAMAVEHLEALHRSLCQRLDAGQGWAARLKGLWRAPEPVRGLYFWGGVGRGKTYLMDTFFACLPFAEKKRLHFHRFMHWVHQELKRLKGRENPLQAIAAEFAQGCRVICFDEFYVSDITDAMLLGGLFERLFAEGVTLVATSNIPPDELYRNGLQRDRFLPAIALIKRHCQIVNVDGGVDYRLRSLEQAELYHCPLDESADASLNRSFESLAGEPGHIGQVLKIENRDIATVKCAEGVAWFEFAALCDGPRGQADYIEISRLFHTVLIANLPQLTTATDDQARRFVSLVDEFYERHVKLILSAAVPMERIYAGEQLTFVYQRTLSRLQEMQSHDYLAREHLP